jgi:hypothetical protein
LTNGTNITSFQVILCHVKLMLLEITIDLSWWWKYFSKSEISHVYLNSQ